MQSLYRTIGSIITGALLLISCNYSYAQSNSSSFISAIQTQGIDTNSLSQSNSISRYDTVRLLSSVECIDCLSAPKRMKDRYTAQWLKDFTAYPSNNFDDLIHPVTRYKSLNYYYCTAYAADQGYVNGYPRVGSPYCPGKFCGTANTSMAELIQIIFNVSSKYSTTTYAIDRKKIQTWVSNLSPSDQVKIIDLDDLATIKNSVASCTTASPCSKLTQAQLTAYAKYCTYNITQCGFQERQGAKEKVRPIAELNILVKEGIISSTEANNLSLSLTKLAPGQQIISIFETINKKTQCNFDDDYDKDTIKNNVDNCPYIANKDQKDTDGGGVGDVCDCDIDNDTIVNGFNAVDNLGNIISNNIRDTSKCDASTDDNPTGDFNPKGPIDNCLFIKNPNQEDINNNGIGDKCEDPNVIGLRIGQNSRCAIAPATISFNCTYTGAIGDIKRTFGDGGVGNGCNVSHTYTTAGDYTSIAKASGVSASTTIKVIGKEEQQSLLLIADTISTDPGKTVTITPRPGGTLDRIEYISHQGTTSLSPTQQYTFKSTQAGTYSITAKGYYQGKLAAAAQIIIGVSSPTQRTMGATLNANSLSIGVNQSIGFTTITSQPISAIKEIIRDFGDGGTSKGKSLSINKIYLEGGPKVITQTIILNDNSQMITMITIYVNGSSNQCLSSYMSATPLVQSVGLPVTYQLNLINVGVDQVKKMVCDYGDGNIKTFTTNIAGYLNQTHTYLKAGLYTTQCSLTLQNGTILPNSATVTIIGRDRCRDTSAYKCDMDRDGTPDICDEDIDGDGTNNILGLILYERPGCIIDESNTNIPLKEYEHQQAAGGVKVDNCPFIINSDQADDNKDGYGNSCQSPSATCTLFNGSYPGPCPVISPNIPSLSTIQIASCTSCPCASITAPTDTVRSLLLNPQQTITQVIGTSIPVQ